MQQSQPQTCASRRITSACRYTLLCIMMMAAGIMEASATTRQLSAAQASINQSINIAWKSMRQQDYSQAMQALRGSKEPLLLEAVIWQKLAFSSVIADFSEYESFFSRNQSVSWPAKARLQYRAEVALLQDASVSSKHALDWFRKHPPLTAYGRLYQSELRNTQTKALVLDAWQQGDMTPQTQSRLLSQYSSWLKNPIAMQQRADYLVWNGAFTQAERLLPHLSTRDATLLTTRIALLRSASNANGLLARLSHADKNTPAIQYARMKWRAQRGLWDGVEEILKQTTATPLPHAQKWWKYRNRIVRDALERGDSTTAETVINRHGIQHDPAGDNADYAEALWLQGWTAFAFRNKPAKALKIFETLHNNVSYPISVSRGAYWAGRAAKAMGNMPLAQKWFGKAALHPTTFYGQLASLELYGKRPLNLPKPVHVTQADWEAYAARQPMMRISVWLHASGNTPHTWPFLKHQIDQAKTREEAALVAYSGVMMGDRSLMLKLAKEAAKKHHILIFSGYPQLSIPAGSPTPAALTHAFIRQESLFDAKAQSPANARGLMQILPSTANLLCKKHRISCAGSLFDASYNMRLGAHYINDLLQRFDSSLILTAAGYNAGPGRSREWVKRFGSPKKNMYTAIQFIEMIPYYETRNYVQRIIENYIVYQHIMQQKPPALSIGEVLTR